jgi:branched-subunit amino acid transport protein
MSRLPENAQRFLRLVGPGTLAALASIYALSLTGPGGAERLSIGIEGATVLVTIAIVRWRGSLLAAILAAVLLVAAVRAHLTRNLHAVPPILDGDVSPRCDRS